MPELPEVESVRIGLVKNIVGKKVKSVQVLHSRATNAQSIAPLTAIAGGKIEAVKRRGKFLWITFNRPEVLVGHLGMSGQFLINSKSAPDQKHLRARFDLGQHELRFIDQRTFGWLAIDETIDDVPKMVTHIAMDPFDQYFDLDRTIERFQSKKTSIKQALLDQSIMSGVGNIYADEALWYCAINPLTSCAKLNKQQIRNVITASRKVMAAALKSGGTSFDDLYKNVNGQSGYFERSLKAYGRDGEPCKRCGKVMKRIVISNRSAHYCPKCQPIPRGRALEISGR